MSKVSISGNASGTGVFTIQAPNSNTDRVLSLPDEAGTVLTSASGIPASQLTGVPAFCAWVNGTQAVTQNIHTKVAFNTETFDTDNCFDTSTYRFTPNVAGYYQINTGVMMAAVNNFTNADIYKNGSRYQKGQATLGGPASYPTGVNNGIVYLNGSTDYVEIYTYFYNTNANVGGGELGNGGYGYSWFSGSLVRAA